MSRQSVIDMIPYYLSEGQAEGIRGDIAFAQSCLETGNFTFRDSAVKLEQNNFCGLGVLDNGMLGASFDTPQLGIRAQIQHLQGVCQQAAAQKHLHRPAFQPCHARRRADRAVSRHSGKPAGLRLGRRCGLRREDPQHSGEYPHLLTGILPSR